MDRQPFSAASSSSSGRAAAAPAPSASASIRGQGSMGRGGAMGPSAAQYGFGPGAAAAARERDKAKAREDAEEAKRRKIQRACDACRRKKIKCDGPMNSMSASKCAHCQEYGLECTYVEAAKRRGPPKGYMDTLEQRCARLERLLHQLHPNLDTTEYAGPPLDRDDFDQAAYNDQLQSLHIPAYPQMKPVHALSTPHSHASPSSVSALSSPAAGAPASATAVLGPAPWKTYERDPSRPPDEADTTDMDPMEHAQMAEAMNRLDLHDGSWRFHGKSSLAHLIRLFNTLKYKPEDGPTAFLERVGQAKRQEYWHVPEWEVMVANEGVRPVDFSLWPAAGLDKRLIEAYFDKVNTYLPLLNRDIFLKQYNVNYYKTSHEFAKVCFMVFANGARFVDDDERVFWPRDWATTDEGRQRLKSDSDGTIRYSGGWIYLLAIMRMGRSIAQGPNLYDFQTQVLLCAFLQGAAVPHLMWVLSGLGLRSAQEIGIHVRSTLMLANPVERALYNRAFWCLYHIDRVNCAAIGRSVALQDTDFDADYPIAVDDEYWDTGDGDVNFIQPESAGLSKVAAFVHMLKLDHVLGAALRTIYAINKPEETASSASQRAVVVELDSALNAWADSVPDGLRWDPTRSSYLMFEQSAMLYSQYYLCQILIHRPFIPTPQKPETIGLPSLAICSNAARSIANILDALLRRGRSQGILPGQAVNIHFLLPAWTAAVILLVSIYSGKQQNAERERAMADVKRCIAATKEMEMTWRQAGKLTDVLMELASDRMEPGMNGPPAVVQRHGGAAGKRHAGAPGTDVSAVTGNEGPHLSRVGSRGDMATTSQNASTTLPSGLSIQTPGTSSPASTRRNNPSPNSDANICPSRFASTFIDSPPKNVPSPPPHAPTTPPNPWMYPQDPQMPNGYEPMFTASTIHRAVPPWATTSHLGHPHGDPGQSASVSASSASANDSPAPAAFASAIRPPNGFGGFYGTHPANAANAAAAAPSSNNASSVDLTQGAPLSRTSSHHQMQMHPQPLPQGYQPQHHLHQYQQQQQQLLATPQRQTSPLQNVNYASMMDGPAASAAVAAAGMPAASDMLWDASFLDALGPELFGMGDIGSSAGAGGSNAGQQGADNVDDLWAQLFGAGSQGLFTPSMGQGGFGAGSGGQPF